MSRYIREHCKSVPLTFVAWRSKQYHVYSVRCTDKKTDKITTLHSTSQRYRAETFSYRRNKAERPQPTCSCHWLRIDASCAPGERLATWVPGGYLWTGVSCTRCCGARRSVVRRSPIHVGAIHHIVVVVHLWQQRRECPKARFERRATTSRETFTLPSSRILDQGGFTHRLEEVVTAFGNNKQTGRDRNNVPRTARNGGGAYWFINERRQRERDARESYKQREDKQHGRDTKTASAVLERP